MSVLTTRCGIGRSLLWHRIFGSCVTICWGTAVQRRAPGVSAIGDFVAQLKELLDFLEISKLTLVGLSMGGVIAQGFAADAHERLDKLILMNTVYRRTDAELKGVRSRLKITVDKGLKPVADLRLTAGFMSIQAG
ncbi:MAG: hypothetical protein CM1200mP18_12050 [Gammaproteobacteria bacterium]|nr:MAG: hypothetical protein CM1200mP18_12050 [Gammaproteobacteria bacterium]